MSRMNPRSSVPSRLHAQFGLALPLVSTTLSTRLWPSLFAGLLLLLLLFGYTSTAAAQTAGTFTPTGDMTTARVGHTATLLLDGRVLIVGGDNTSTAELYDPATGTFTPTGNGTTGHGDGSSLWATPTAVLLPDGRVFIAGGNKSEVYDSAAGSFTVTGSMVTKQYGFTATLLTTGKVLITGGTNGGGIYELDAVPPELYDPSTGTFRLAGPYVEMRSWAGTSGLSYTAATVLADGKVLILSEPAAQLYDPSNNTFSVTDSMVAVDENSVWGKPTGISSRTATLMTNGAVLLAGGVPSYANTGDFPLSRAELYASTGAFAATGSMHVPRIQHTATLLPDGTVLVAGGRTNNYYETTFWAELYDPSTGAFSAGIPMTAGRAGHQATRLRDGRVLVTGGVTTSPWPNSQTLASAELYRPAVLVADKIVNELQFDRTSVGVGSSYSVKFSGSNLTSQTFFDVRFTSPESNESAVVLNWQRGLTASHNVPFGIAPGSWTINGVRAHEIEADHTGGFFPVSATITVSP